MKERAFYTARAGFLFFLLEKSLLFTHMRRKAAECITSFLLLV